MIKLRQIHRNYSKKGDFTHQNCLGAYYVPVTLLNPENIVPPMITNQ
jgi:hypothetical protein